MDVKSQSAKNETFRSIINQSEKVALVTGQAATGKTQICLDIYNHFHNQSIGSVLIVTPNSQTRLAILARLKNQTKNKVLLSPQIITLTGFISRLFAATNIQARCLSKFDKVLRIKKIVQQLNCDNRIIACKKIADKPGLVSSLVKSIAELKRLSIAPDQLRDQFADNISKYSDLTMVYQEYQNYLLANNFYDKEGQDWLVKLFLENNENRTLHFINQAGLDKYNVLIFDGFTDFSSTQLDIINSLASLISKTVLTLPSSDDNRKTLWAWSNQTSAKIVAKFDRNILRYNLPLQANKNQIANNIFNSSASKIDSGNISIVSASGQVGEVRAIATKVKQILSNPQTANDTIGIMVRNLEQYYPVIEKQFKQAGIPVRKNIIKLSQVSIVKYLSKIIKLKSSNYDYNIFIDFINSSYFMPENIGDYSKADIYEVIEFIRKNNIINIEAFVSKSKINQKNSEFLQAIIDEVSKIKSTQNLLDSKLFQALYHSVLLNNDPGIASLDLKGLQTLAEILQEYPNEELPIIFNNLSNINLPQSSKLGVVDLLSVIDSKNIRWDHSMVLGVSEGQFPSRLNAGAFLDESFKKNAANLSADLLTKKDFLSREMLLFYLAISRHNKSLTLTYQNTNDAGKISAASNFMNSFLEMFDPTAIANKTETQSPGEFYFDDNASLSFSDSAGSALANIFGQYESQAIKRNLNKLSASKKLSKVATALWVNFQRWSADLVSNLDGKLTDPKSLEQLRNKIPDKIVFSANQISQYAQCPWKYFAKYILKLEALEEIENHIKPELRGIFCHNVLQQFYTELVTEAGLPVNIKSFEWEFLDELYDKIIAKELSRDYLKNLPHEKLCETEIAKISAVLKNYIESQYVDERFNTASYFFELSFGVKQFDDDPIDATSQANPVKIKLNNHSIFLKGKIDRVDKINFTGEEKYLIVDYKTGTTLPAVDKSINATNSQMPLYKLAIESIMNAPAIGGCFHGVRTNKISSFAEFANPRANQKQLKPNDKFDDQHQKSIENIDDIITNMSQGNFVVDPNFSSTEVNSKKSDSCLFCDYKQICCYSDVRIEVRNTNES